MNGHTLKYMLLFNAIHGLCKHRKFSTIEEIKENIKTEAKTLEELKNKWKELMGFEWK